MDVDVSVALVTSLSARKNVLLVSCLLSIGGQRRTADENNQKDRKQAGQSVQREAQFNLQSIGFRTDRSLKLNRKITDQVWMTEESLREGAGVKKHIYEEETKIRSPRIFFCL